MLSTAELGRTVGPETSSPELALVDDDLAVRARERLAEPDDTLARVQHEIWLSRLAACEAACTDHTSEFARRWRSVAARLARLQAMRLGPALLAAGAFAATLAIAARFDTDVDFQGTQAAPASPNSVELVAPPTVSSTGSDKTATATGSGRTATATGSEKTVRRGSSGSERPKSRISASRPSTKSEPGRRRFAWAPVPGASSYRVEFFRGDARIYTADTSRPQLALPARWTLAGRTHRLTPGTYRWYVWPVSSGIRRSEATVQAELVVR